MSACAFWIASGNDFVKEATRSAMSVREHMPDMPRVLITDDKWKHNVFDAVMPCIEKRSHEYWYLASVRAFNTALEMPYDKMLYLDTDTLVCEPIFDVIQLLDQFDFVGTHAPGRHTSQTSKPVPEVFPEINVGVMAFNVNNAVRNLFSDWLSLYEKNVDVYGDNDQAPLREALWNSKIRFYVMPPEYNMRLVSCGFARLKVKVLHGRRKNLQQVADHFNRTKGMRVWKSDKIVQ